MSWCRLRIHGDFSPEDIRAEAESLRGEMRLRDQKPLIEALWRAKSSDECYAMTRRFRETGSPHP